MRYRTCGVITSCLNVGGVEEVCLYSPKRVLPAVVD